MILLFFFGSLYLSSSWWWEPHKCGSVFFRSLGRLDWWFWTIFFRMLILYMLLTLLRHYGWEKLQCSECFRLQNNPILSGMVIFQNWGAPLIFGATSTLNWTWKSSSLEINYFGRFLLRQKNDQNQPNMTMADAQTKGVPSPYPVISSYQQRHGYIQLCTYCI